jgi:MoxR-like ATPase
VMFIQETVKTIPVPDHVYRYAEKLVRGSRPKTTEAFDFCKKWLTFGAGPRASLNLIMAAKAHALISGQTYVGCENVAAIALAVLRHRIAINFTAQSEGITADDVVRKILETVPQTEPLA